MKVLIGCEESQIVCVAFRERGHEAYSCDIQDCSGGHPEWHLKMDIMDAIDLMKWDLIGLHPPCTKIALSGNRHYAPGKPRNKERVGAVEWTINLWKYACKNAQFVYMENPIGAMNKDKRLPRPQLIHPFYFGDPVPKKTCLWLYNLPPLFYAISDNLFLEKTIVEPEYVIYNSSKNKSGKSKYSVFWKLGKGHGVERSKTFPGIAKAMAEQWG
jgi:hypothetical protein